MIRINLLPYREEKRRAKRQQFYGLLGLVSILGFLIVFMVYTVIDGYVEAQGARNDYIKKEIAALDKQIDQIKQLKVQAEALLSRKQIIESLQQDRAEAVHLLNELTKQVPEGVYLRSLKQQGTKITMLGYAQSSARVSTLMRNIEASPWLGTPELLEVRAINLDNRRLSDFSMNAVIKRTATQEAVKK
ncbi:MAG: PilN domain-containing protein [Candidatus Accumulibacter sp.]|jgi:type IV pilus assembly protein PilN|nr:PilN domain-containing protein [Accumulibacter sp.]